MSDANRNLSTVPDRSAKAVSECRADAPEPSAWAEIVGGKSGKDRQRPDFSRKPSRHLMNCCAGSEAEIMPRIPITAVPHTINQRPQCAGGLRLLRFASKQACADIEQDAAAKLQPLSRRFAPRERVQQRQPPIFELRKFLAADAASDQLPVNRPQAWLGRSRCAVQFL